MALNDLASLGESVEDILLSLNIEMLRGAMEQAEQPRDYGKDYAEIARHKEY